MRPDGRRAPPSLPTPPGTDGTVGNTGSGGGSNTLSRKDFQFRSDFSAGLASREGSQFPTLIFALSN